MSKRVVTSITALLVVLFSAATTATAGDQGETVGAEISTFAKHLALDPDMAIDLTGVSGAYCFNAGIGDGGHMTHYAVDPSQTQEDLIDFVNARSMIDAGIINVGKLPKHPGKLGAMEPNEWYYLHPGTFEPHHGRKFPFPLLIRATNLD